MSVALLAEGVDRNRFVLCISLKEARSPSSRRAWIEMLSDGLRDPEYCVALLAEGVDRNILDPDCKLPHQVALLAEGVDRNL